MRNPLAGLRFFRRDNAGGIVLASRHWPHLLCWTWALAYRPTKDGWGWRVTRIIHNVGGQIYWWRFVLSWQHYPEMVARSVEDDACRFVSARLKHSTSG